MDTEFLIGAMGNEVIEQDLGLHYIKLSDDRNKVINHNYITLNERVLDNEEIILKDIIDKFSIREIALAYIKNIKKDLTPIEDVEDIYNSLNELRSIQKKYKYKKKRKKRGFKFKDRKKSKR